MVILYFVVQFVATALGTGIVKYASVSMPTKNAAGSSIFCVITSLTAMLFFCAGNGFRVSFNRVTVGYALVYALICFAALVSGLFRYRYVSVAVATVIVSASCLVINTVVGFVFFDEEVSFARILKVILMLVSLIFVFKGSNTKNDKKFEKKAVFWLGISIVVGVFSTLWTRIFSRDDGITDKNSLFFLTNVFMFAAALGVFVTVMVKKRGSVSGIIKGFGVKGTAVISLNTVCSNISTLCGSLILACIDMSIYTPVNAALGIISGAAVSLAFRERLGRDTVIAVIVAAIAVCL